ncbi:MAG: hypothetical protein ACLFV7_09250, partial [Phycisphaerae bacterium]
MDRKWMMRTVAAATLVLSLSACTRAQDANATRRLVTRAKEIIGDPADGADPPGVKPFPYRLTLAADPPRGKLSRGPRRLWLELVSTHTLPAPIGTRPLRLSQTDGNGWVDVATVIRLSSLPDRTAPHGTRVPDTTAAIRLSPLWLPPDRPAFVRIRWKGTSDLWAIGRDRKTGALTLRALQAPGAKGSKVEVKAFGAFRLQDEDRNEHYELTPFGAWREDGPKLQWLREVTLLGTPIGGKLLKDNVLFEIRPREVVTGSPSPVEDSRAARKTRHSLLLRRDDGRTVVYTKTKLTGSDLPAEVRKAALREIPAEPNALTFRRYARALALLESKDNSRLLVEMMLKAPDVPAAAMVVAALERIHGNPRLWKKHYDALESDPENGLPEALRRRVGSRLARQHEALKWWRKVGRPGEDLLEIDGRDDSPRTSKPAL